MALHTNLFPYCRFELKIEGKRGREKKGKKKKLGMDRYLVWSCCRATLTQRQTDRQTDKERQEADDNL